MNASLKLLIAALSISTLAALPACATASASELAGTTWVLNIDEEQSQDSSVFDTSTATITFGPGVGAVTGTFGFNKYAGTYAADGDAISFTDVCWTTMACMAAAGSLDREQAYVFTLEKAERYEINGDTMTIHAGDEVLEFTKQ